MSRGFGADAVLEMQDDKIAVYRYGNYNWNLEEFRNPEHIMDGMIWIEKSALPEPELHDKIKHLPNGKKKRVMKRIPRPLGAEPLRTGQIKIENSRFCWQCVEEDYDLMAVKLLCKISNEYQLTGSMPERIGLMY